MKAMAKDLALAGEKYLGRSYQEMDCQAFVEQCLRDVGISLNLPGSNAWYRKMTWVGSPEECRQKYGSVPIGAFLFILASDGKEPEKYREDGIGNASHIGIRTGRGDGAIHSSATRGCVAESVFRDKTIRGGWNRVGLWDELDYGEMVNGILGEKCDGGGVPEVPPDAAHEGDKRSGETGFLPDAAYAESERGKDTVKAVVHSEDGNSVKLRNSPSRNKKLWWSIPDGTPVTVLEQGEPWSRIQAGERTGYMMSNFLNLEENEPVKLTLTVPENLTEALIQMLEDLLHQLNAAEEKRSESSGGEIG